MILFHVLSTIATKKKSIYLVTFILIRLVDLFFVDIGSTGYVDINDICCENPPMLLQSPQQALQCTLSGITLVIILPNVIQWCSWKSG